MSCITAFSDAGLCQLRCNTLGVFEMLGSVGMYVGGGGPEATIGYPG
jgi:hypothetical protein